MGGVVIVYAFDPVDELEARSGVLAVEAVLGHRLIAEHRAELMAGHANESMRYVRGSTAHQHAHDALRAARGGKVVPRKPRQVAKLER